MCKYEMDRMSIVEDTERTGFCPQTDRRMNRRTDGQGETSIPPFQLRWSEGYNNQYILTKIQSGVIDLTKPEGGQDTSFQIEAILCFVSYKLS